VTVPVRLLAARANDTSPPRRRRNKATGKRFGTPKVDVWRVREGKITAFFEYYDTAAVAQAAAE
jgi:ketosteroid isomerase-like protein